MRARSATVTCLLATLAAFARAEAQTGRTLSDDEKKNVIAGLARNLKDPSSIQVRWTLFRPSSKLVVAMAGGHIYCATYNAKNSFGGYTGFRPFASQLTMRDEKIVSGEMTLPEPSASPAADDGKVMELCRMAGQDPFAEVP